MRLTTYLKQWNKRLEEMEIFDEIDEMRMVNKDNLEQIIEALNIGHLINIDDMKKQLDKYEEGEVGFEDISKDWAKIVKK